MPAIDLILTVLASAGGTAAITAAFAAWLGKVWADRVAGAAKLNAAIDLDLRNRRIDAYGPLWRHTALLPKWPRALGVTYEDLYRFSQDMSKWYFETGGIFLSRTTHRDAYTPLQDAITALHAASRSGPLDTADYDAIRDRCSALRSALAGDIQSRRESFH